MPDAGDGRLPLSALLSQVLVAFIIECDNEYERQIPHRTSGHGSTAGQAISGRRLALEELADGPARARLFAGLEPPPGGWRAAVRARDPLPQYPMVLHRSGHHDGS